MTEDDFNKIMVNAVHIIEKGPLRGLEFSCHAISRSYINHFKINELNNSSLSARKSYLSLTDHYGTTMLEYEHDYIFPEEEIGPTEEDRVNFRVTALLLYQYSQTCPGYGYHDYKEM